MREYSVGYMIKYTRLYMKKDLNYIAKKLGVTVQCVSNWERGASNPPPRYVRKISKILNIGVSELKVRYISDYINELDKEIDGKR